MDCCTSRRPRALRDLTRRAWAFGKVGSSTMACSESSIANQASPCQPLARKAAALHATTSHFGDVNTRSVAAQGPISLKSHSLACKKNSLLLGMTTVLGIGNEPSNDSQTSPPLILSRVAAALQDNTVRPTACSSNFAAPQLWMILEHLAPDSCARPAASMQDVQGL